MYSNELKAIEKAGRFRERKLYADSLDDFASNDYLGLAKNKKQFKKAVKLMEEYDIKAPKSSVLLNGYHPLHRIFELTIAEENGFEEALMVGSGFLANMALIETLVRKGDMLFIDEDYHASGIMASELLGDRVVRFKHNDTDDLISKLVKYPAKRQIIAVEGVYSMGGDLCKKEIFDIADAYKAILLVDEAHSAGILGDKLLGIFDYYAIKPNERHIKMGTLGKAYGSYGAYILASKHIISFLINRAKPIIYSTAPSIFDTALALVNFKYIRKNASKIRQKILERQSIILKDLGINCNSLIVAIEMPSNSHALYVQKGLLSQGYLVGAIRQPTVAKPIIRFIVNLEVSVQKMRHSLALISHNKVQ